MVGNIPPFRASHAANTLTPDVQAIVSRYAELEAARNQAEADVPGVNSSIDWKALARFAQEFGRNQNALTIQNLALAKEQAEREASSRVTKDDINNFLTEVVEASQQKAAGIQR